MSAATKIEWCDSTFNPWIGCTKVSPACDDCYAARSTPARRSHIEWGVGMPRTRTGKANWKHPEQWDRREFFECARCGLRTDSPMRAQCLGPERSQHSWRPARRRVFSASLGDWLDNEVPIEWLVDFLDLVRRTPNLDWLLLTKRIGNWRGRLEQARQYEYERLCLSLGDTDLSAWIGAWLNGRPPANVWIGATVVNQAEADRDVPKLLAVPARIRFLSIEPMLGPIRLDAYHDWLGRSPGGFFCPDCPEHGVGIDPAEHRGCLGEITDEQPYEGIDWIIAGGESGSRARPSHPDWYRSLRDQCAAAGVPFLFKQWGEWAPIDALLERLTGKKKTATFYAEQWQLSADDIGADGSFEEYEPDLWHVGKARAGRLLDGVEHNGFPKAA